METITKQIANHQQPAIPTELKQTYYLSGRMDYSKTLRKKFDQLQRGYKGELIFHELIKEKLKVKPTTLFSLTLEHDQKNFQLDQLFIFANQIIVHEIKYYPGDYIFQNGQFYSLLSNKEIDNPLYQLNRATSLLRQLAKNIGIQAHIEAKVVFLHEACELYQVSPEMPIVTRPQIDRYFSKITRENIRNKNLELKLAQKLVQAHQINFRNQTINYTFSKLKKGVNCPKCMQFMIRKTNRTVICTNCQLTLINEKALTFNYQQLKYLFPNQTINTQTINQWCDGLFSNYTIRRVMNQHKKQLVK